MTVRQRAGIRLAAHAFLLLSLVLGSGGCIVVPLQPFSNPPWPAPARQSLLQEHADRETVRRTLGEPAAVKSAGKYWIYTSKRAAFGIIGGTSSAVFDDYEWLLLEFDAGGHVRFLEFNDDEYGCLSNGICLVSGFLDPHPVLTAPTAEQASDESRQPGPGECALYLLLDKLPWYYHRLRLEFTVDGEVQGYIDDTTFLYLPHPTGNVHVSAFQFDISVPCPAGERVYVQAVKAQGTDWNKGEDLAPVQPVAGLAAVRARRLALPD